MTFNTLLIHGISTAVSHSLQSLLPSSCSSWPVLAYQKPQKEAVSFSWLLEILWWHFDRKKTEKKYELISFKEQNVSWRTPGKQFLVKAYKSKAEQSYLLKKDATRGISGVVQLLVAIVAGRVRRRFTSGSCTIKIVLNGNHLNGFGVCSPPKGFSTEVVFLVKM